MKHWTNMLFKTLYTLTVSLFSLTLAAAPLPSHWELTSEMDGVKVWQLKSHSDVTASWQEKASSEKITREKFQEVFKALTESKQKMLSFVGISQWQVHKHEWRTDGEGTELKVEGTYQDSTGQKVVFTEVHFFQKDKTIQVLHTRPSELASAEQYQREFFDFIKDEVKK